MSINFEKAVGGAERALMYRMQRSEILSNNIANADTPNFKARDLDFSALLASQTKSPATPVSLKTTNVRHIAGEESASDIYGGELLYTIPAQPSIDQNTVDLQIEVAKYTDNGMHFDAAFTRLNGAFKGLLKALRGD